MTGLTVDGHLAADTGGSIGHVAKSAAIALGCAGEVKAMAVIGNTQDHLGFDERDTDADSGGSGAG